MEAMFDLEGDQAKVRLWLKEGIIWVSGNVGDPGIVRALGPQDIVAANRFLRHMEPRVSAAQCRTG
jgi:hypothetical protein